MRIVVLDGYTLNPGDVSWSELESLGETVVHDRTSEEQVIERAHGADILLTNKVRVTANMMDSLPQLRYIGVLATGYNIIDLQAASRNGIVVTNVPGYSTNSVSQHVFAFMLELCQHVQIHSDSVLKGEWVSAKDFSYVLTPLIELHGKTLGVVGMGQIGQQTAKIAKAFGMNVIANVRTPRIIPGLEDIMYCNIEDLLRESDFVSLHCPLTEETAGFINRERLAIMKPTAYLINTARGQLIDEVDLAEALHTGRIAGAGLDVLSSEPPNADNPLLHAPNCLITPHIAWAAKEARMRAIATAAGNIQAYLAHEPINIVN